MPSIKRKACPTHGVYKTNRCEECKKQTAKTYNQQSRNKDSTAVYNTRRWQKVRKQQLMQEPLCINFESCHNEAKIADHIIELIDGGEAFSLDNLESMCIGCHNTKTAKTKRNREGASKSYRL